MSNDIILIRGLFRGQYHWGHFAKLLNKKLADRQIIAVDIPGTGKLSSQKSPISIAEMVENIRSQLPTDKQYDIIAISMGGMIALEWVKMYPVQLGKVVCINTSSKTFSPFYHRMIPANYLKILIALISSANSRESIIYSMISNKPVNQDVINEWVELGRQYPTTALNFWRQLLAAMCFRAQRPKNEVLFISSLSDRLVSYKATHALAKAWQMPLIYNREDGHDIPLDNPEWLCEKVVSYLNHG